MTKYTENMTTPLSGLGYVHEPRRFSVDRFVKRVDDVEYVLTFEERRHRLTKRKLQDGHDDPTGLTPEELLVCGEYVKSRGWV